jgi:hypothetical protein
MRQEEERIERLDEAICEAVPEWSLAEAASTRMRRARPLRALVMPPRLTVAHRSSFLRAPDPDTPSARAEFGTVLPG